MEKEFVTSIKSPQYFEYGDRTISYRIEDNCLIIKGSIFAWNWDTSFRRAILKLEEKMPTKLNSRQN